MIKVGKMKQVYSPPDMPELDAADKDGLDTETRRNL